MKNIKNLCGPLLIFFTVAVCLGAPSWAADGGGSEGKSASTQAMERVETILYGESSKGGLIERLNSAEKELFGRGLPGSISERHSAILNFLEVGTPEQPSMLFKLGVAEWIVGHGAVERKPALARVENLEMELEGAMQYGKPLAMRVERLLVSLVADPVASQEVLLPKATVLKVKFLEELGPAKSKKGDSVGVALTNDLFVGKVLVAPKGSPIQTVIRDVKQPRRAGIPSEMHLDFKALKPLGPQSVPVTMGKESKKATDEAQKGIGKGEGAIFGAVGAGVGGAVLLGPVGLLGALFVRGDAIKIPEGSIAFVETSEDVRVLGYPLPASLQIDPGATIRESTMGNSFSEKDIIELPAEQKIN